MPITRPRGRLAEVNPEGEIDLQAITNEIRQKMEWLDNVKASKARNEGALAQIVEQLQNDHNVNTLEEATALLERRQRMEARLLSRLSEKLIQLREIEERVRNATSDTTQQPIPF
jgi:hypothetical protein